MISAVVLLIAGLLAYSGLYTWNEAPRASVGDGAVQVTTVENGERVMSWPAAEGCEGYTVRLYSEGTDKPVFTLKTDEAFFTLPNELTFSSVSITPYSGWYIGLIPCEKRGEELYTQCVPFAHELNGFSWKLDTVNHRIAVSLASAPREEFLLTAGYETGETLEYRFMGDSLLLASDGTSPLPMPAYGAYCTLRVTPVCSIDRSVTYGTPSEPFAFTSDDLYGNEFCLKRDELGQNTFSFTWDRVKGSSFDALLLCEDGTRSEKVCNADGLLRFDTDKLKPFKKYSFTVSSDAGQSASLELETAAAAVGCTVWTQQKLPLYSSPDLSSESLGKLEEATALRVIAEEGDFFLVDTQLGRGYIQSGYCMINLTEYIGDLCFYNITNSYAAMYKMHTFAIPGITDHVITGYEYVNNGDGTFLVPLLYPTAHKLIDAALAAKEQGYTLKIYDSFRPRSATYSLYDHAIEIIEDPLPATNYYGEYVSRLPKPSEEYEYVRFTDLVNTDNGFKLENFLSRGGSYHNMGIALDLTVVDNATGEELAMQTEMHDISFYSARGYNNDNSKLLNSIMCSAGFEPLSTEWWHFQDTASLKALKLSNWLGKGVAPAA